MAYTNLVAFDPATDQLPPVVRTRIANNITSTTTTEGSAIRTILQNTRIATDKGGVPTGTVLPFGGETAPSGYLLCRGQTESRTTYAALWNLFRNGTATSPFGNGDNTTTFNMPNLQTRIPVGRTIAGTGTFGTLGASGGAENVTLTATQIPNHFHTGTLGTTGSNHRHWISGADWDDGNGSTTGINNTQNKGLWSDAGAYSANDPQRGAGRYIAYSDFRSQTHTHAFTMANNTGGGGSHNNLMPYIVVNYIIKT